MTIDHYVGVTFPDEDFPDPIDVVLAFEGLRQTGCWTVYADKVMEGATVVWTEPWYGDESASCADCGEPLSCSEIEDGDGLCEACYDDRNDWSDG